MQLYSQNDPLWRWKKIGKSPWTLGQKGCVTTDVSMSVSYFGQEIIPGIMVDKLNYTTGGLLLWESVKNVGLKFLWRGFKYEPAKIDEALKNPKKTCLLNVDRGAHWVLGIYRVPFMNKFWVADPFTGKRKFYSGVVGYSILTK